MATGGSGNIGYNLNEWREPVTTFSQSDGNLQHILSSINIPENEWRNSCDAIDKVLETILKEFKEVANIHFEGLVIGNEIIRQGSSREGLKVLAADEFDCILPFEIYGMKPKQDKVVGYNSSGLIKICASNLDALKERYAWLTDYKAITDKGFINTMVLQSKVFTSILDKAMDKINNRLQTLSREGSSPMYRVVRKVEPTSLKLTVEMQDADPRKLSNMMQYFYQGFTPESAFYPVVRRIDIDFVPGMLIGNDLIPDPNTVHGHDIGFMKCQRYAVMKWRNKKNQEERDRELLWRHSSSGYEKHLMDVSRRNPSQRYILTANRILKASFRRLEQESYNQLPVLVESYYLKNICMYCILFLTVSSQQQKLQGVKKALGYIIHFLRLSLDRGYLPHFFHGNPWLCQMFPSCPFTEDAPCNLLQTANRETLTQARRGLAGLQEQLRGCYCEELNPIVVQRFVDLLPK